jgi:hypothetical protein
VIVRYQGRPVIDTNTFRNEIAATRHADAHCVMARPPSLATLEERQRPQAAAAS